MLLKLNIINLAVVQSVNLELNSGMSVLTGETGAGKSILLTALGLALGDRADSSYVRADTERAEINLEFDLQKAPLAANWLIEHDLNEEQLCLIRRIIYPNGRSKAYINNRPVSLQALKKLSALLVEIHGQHAYLTLLNNDQQQSLLDSYAANQDLRHKLNTIWQNWQDTHKTLTKLIRSNTDKHERQELLTYQLKELEQLDLEHFDYQALLNQHAQLANLDQILTQGQLQLEKLYAGDQHSVSQLLNHSLNSLTELVQFSPELTEVCELLSEAQIQIEEASLTLRRFLDTLETDPQHLEELETQLGIIQDISRKHQASPAQLPQIALNLARSLKNITHHSEQIEQLTQRSQQLLSEYHTVSLMLSENRQKHAKKMQQQISATIQKLGMPQGHFQIAVNYRQNDTPKRNGLDNIEFLVQINPGLPVQPLTKIASGGELSRISLAIQIVSHHDKSTPTMIFDEIDSGIGGSIAEVVGKTLRQLSQNCQVFCVTHLPQVASQAHHHFYVKKDQTETTVSHVHLLTPKQRVEETARMLGGIHITANTLAHAREMLQQKS